MNHQPPRKGIDDLLLYGGRPRYRARTFPPAALGNRRRVYELDYLAPTSRGGSLAQVRDATQRTIASFIRERSRHTGQALVVGSAAGAGKSTTVGEAVKKYGSNARLVAGTLSLAGELGARHGYSVYEGRNPRNCQRIDVVRALVDGGHPVGDLACGSAAEPRCPFRSNCLYQAQSSLPGALIGASEQLWNPEFLRGGDLVVIDDADLLRSSIQRHRLTASDLTNALSMIDPARRPEAWEAIRLLRDAVETVPRPLLGGDLWDHLAALAAERGSNIVETVRKLPKNGTLPQPRADEGAVLSASDVTSVPPHSVLAMFEALRSEVDAFEAGEDFNSGLRIDKNVIDVAWLKALPSDETRPILSRLPVLVLDATPVESVLHHMLSGHERLPDVMAQIELPPNVRVIQYASRPNGMMAMADDEHRRELAAEIQEARARFPVADPELEAVVVYKNLKPGMVELGFQEQQVLTFGSVRGSNVLDKVLRLHVVGRPMPNSAGLVYLAQVIHHDGPAISAELLLREADFAGQSFGVDVLDFRDPRVAELLRANREDELLQTVHRARLLTLQAQVSLEGSDTRMEVNLVLHTNHPIPGLRVDELILPDEDGLGNDSDHPVPRQAERADQRVGNVETDPMPVPRRNEPRSRDAEEQIGLGNSGGGVNRDLLNPPPIVPQTDQPPGVRPHWLPCPGNCGTWIPPGQKCFDCTAVAVAAWKAGVA